MIIRTYQRRNRSSRSLTDSGNLYGDGIGSSGSQESPWGSGQEAAPLSFPSSQESWSQTDYGGSTRSFKSTRRQSHDDEYSDDPAVGVVSRPSFSRPVVERPPLELIKKTGDPLSRGNSRKIQLSTTQSLPNGTKGTLTHLDRKRSFDVFDTDSQEDGAGSSISKRGSAWADGGQSVGLWSSSAPSTSTLMEAQESGEMMEHVDEANFALDGLKPGQPVRIQRASLTSLLSLCCSMQRRRMLRTQGMAKPLLDAIVSLPADDPPLALAAAAVLYFLAIDSQEEDLLDSEPCVLFLLKLLGAQSSQPVVKKGFSGIGSKLAALSKSVVPKGGTSLGGVDLGASVVSKVRELFKTLQDHGSGGGSPNDENGILPGEKISSKWLALRTLEKACISTVVLEDSTAEAVRKVGGQFKERLRELGGLDAVCDLAASCLVNLTETLKPGDASKIDDLDITFLDKDGKDEGVGVLLRCLRIMENVTFLSEQNQKHLLELRLSGRKAGAKSFIGLTVNVINTLSVLDQRQKAKATDVENDRSLTSATPTEKGKRASKLPPILEGTHSPSSPRGKRQRLLSDCFRSVSPKTGLIGKSGSGKVAASDSNIASSMLTFKRRKSSLSSSSLEESGASEASHVTSSILSDSKDTHRGFQASRKAVTGTLNGLFPKLGASRKCSSSDGNEGSKLVQDGSEWKLKNGKSKERKPFLEDSQAPSEFDAFQVNMKNGVKPIKPDVEDSQDPFAFDDFDVEFPTLKAPKKKPRREQGGKLKTAGQARKAAVQTNLLETAEEDFVAPQKSDLAERSPTEPEGQRDGSRKVTLFADCLVSGVKVLMNLTNGNPTGCSQVAACGGFDTLSSLLITNYPWPRSPSRSDGTDLLPGIDERDPNGENEGDSEHDLDLLVTVLGVLCNLVEKDTYNRAKLASLKLAVPPDIASTKEGKLWQETGMIGLLCSLFLLKQGAGEAADAIESKRALEMDEEVKQGQAEAEDMIVEAYTALLLAFLSKESERSRMEIAHLLPGDNLKSLVPVLERFVAFHLSLNMISGETHEVVADVIESCKQPI